MALEVRALAQAELGALQRGLPLWSSAAYAQRLGEQDRRQMVQVIAWDGPVPVGRGMVLFAEHEGYSESAVREGCAEVRDVFVAPEHRRRGAARTMMGSLEAAARSAGWRRIGLHVAVGDDAAPARALYGRLGYRHAHGPFITGVTLAADDGPWHLQETLAYLVKEI